MGSVPGGESASRNHAGQSAGRDAVLVEGIGHDGFDSALPISKI